MKVLEGPVFLKSDSDALQQLEKLKELSLNVSSDTKEAIERDIKLLEYGIAGENAITFELENSHIPMVVLRDLYLENDGLSAQIDFLILTKKLFLVVECKNLYGDIEITGKGDFIRSMRFGKSMKKEGLYSPITQNERHLELLRKIRRDTKGNLVTKALFDHYAADAYTSIIVLANPKTILNDRYAKKEVKQQVIRADALTAFIKESVKKSKREPYADSEIFSLAEFFINESKENLMDYSAKYAVVAVEPEPEVTAPKAGDVCPRCGGELVVRKGYSEFLGCSSFPKCRYKLKLEQQ